MRTVLPPLEYPKKPDLDYINKGYGPIAENARPALQHLGRSHVESFNFFLEEGMEFALNDIGLLEFEIPQTTERVGLQFLDMQYKKPGIARNSVDIDHKLYPSEFRQRGSTYKTKLTVSIDFKVNGLTRDIFAVELGEFPTMVRSKACNLEGLSPQQLVEKGEHEEEWGGYFVSGGYEKIIRMLQTTRRNYPIAMRRPGWKDRGKDFSDLGVLMECSKKDSTITKNLVHYVTTGTAMFMFSHSREMFFVPVIMLLKCLLEVTDAEIYRELMIGAGNDHYRKSVVVNMIRELQEESIYSRDQARAFIGRSFKEKVKYEVPSWYTDEEIADWLIQKNVAIHLVEPADKFSTICLMVRKMLAYIQDKCVLEGADCLMMQELILGGHLYLQLVKENLQQNLQILKMLILKKARTEDRNFLLTNEYMEKMCRSTFKFSKKIESFLSTGNLPTSSRGLGLMQTTGFVIQAENINRMRYMSHFRAIHRGSFFMEMRTTEPRALLPDAWGFVCPVHTPDGAPCGLLNHLAMPVEVVTHFQDSSKIPGILVQLGMIPINDQSKDIDLSNHLDVCLDGKVLGFVHPDNLRSISDRLRMIKVNPNDLRVSTMTEIAYIPKRDIPGQYPGLFIFTGASRMMRPVWNLAADCVEYIGTLEQVYMEICVKETEAEDGLTTHKEIKPTNFLSNLACTIPLPDFNQSPRNMYQCQMAKQTMATPIITWHLNSENKLYRLQTPTAPFFRPAHYDYIGMDDFPMGTNAIVAVISYTGYDMEDAMIINKMSLERGFCAGMIYKTEYFDLRKKAGMKNNTDKIPDSCGLVFARDPRDVELAKYMDEDGLPIQGKTYRDGDPLYGWFNQNDATFQFARYDHSESGIIDTIKLLSNDKGTSDKNKFSVTYRMPRNPNIGDKFASRAGQKGICSQKWPCEDIPWTTSGMFPDIVFNPHGFPSRMTIAMMIETMAGKSGSIHGKVHDATPFTFSEDRDNDAITYFSEQLESAGYNYYGNETLYSGVSGVELKADIFFGVIHYQRLRHMVNDKYQVRSTGPIDLVTHQPVKGRKRGGGVRFGEMERDSLLSHGTAFLLQDRLFEGSDRTLAHLCSKCGSILSPIVQVGKVVGDRDISDPCCVLCGQTKYVHTFEVPFIFLHLVKELASVNIKVDINGIIK